MSERRRPDEATADNVDGTTDGRGEAAGAPRRLADELARLERQGEALLERLSDGERRFRSVARSVWHVQEQERRRVARELHDGLGQSLTALKTRLDWLLQSDPPLPDEIRDEVEALAALAARTLAETRDLSRLLRPSILDDLGLGPALRWLARSMSHGAGAAPSRDVGAVEIETRIDDFEPRLEEQHETLLFRVAQEALANAVRHSRAQRIEIGLRRLPEAVELWVEDDGRGFDAAGQLDTASGSGSGLRGMRDRAELFDARFAVRSAAGAGARVRLVLPLGPGSAA